ncbi:MAG: hypothetical protein AB7R55_21620 [Gemmatimonadales bacterium]
MRRALLAATTLALLAGLGCGGEPPTTGPEAGSFTVAYGGPSTTDGAVLVLITGGPVESVSPLGGYQLASGPAGTNATRVVVTGSLTAGDVFTIRVPDVAALGSYVARVEAAADRNTFALADPASYTAGLRR